MYIDQKNIKGIFMNLNKKNIRFNKLTYYFIKIDLIGLMLISIYDKWVKAGMTFSQILLLQGIFGLFILIAEFPSGILADIRSRKQVLFLAQIAIISGIITYFFAQSFTGFMLAELFFAIGLAFKSGTDNAFAYDSYLEIGLPEESDNLIARGQQLMLFGNVFMLSLGGLLTVLNPGLPFIIAILGYTGTSIVILLSIEPIRSKTSSSSLVIKKSIGYLNHPVVFKVLLMLLFLQVLLRIAFWGYIPQMTISGLNPAFFGFVLGGANLVAFLTSLWAKRNKDSKYLVFLVPVGVLGLFLMMSNELLIILIAIMLHQISRGIIGVVNSIYLNRIVSSDIRASIASLLSTMVSLLYFLFSLTVDQMSLHQDVIMMIDFILGILFLGLWMLSHFINSKKIVHTHSFVPVLD